MKPKYLLGFALIAAAVVFLIVTNMSVNAQYFYTVEELRAKGQGIVDQSVRVSGAVINSSTTFEVRDNQRLTRWLPPQPGKQYIIGVDPAGGGSEGDYSCAVVIERTPALQCAELHGHFSPRELASKVIDMGKAYNRALLAVERNNHGYGVLAHLQREGYANLYCEGEQPGWLADDGEIIVQIHPKEYEAVALEHFEEIERRKYSSTLLVFYEHRTNDNGSRTTDES